MRNIRIKMLKTILRKEYRNKWEQRTALTPQAVANLNKKGLIVDVESSEVRIFNDSAYQQIAADIFQATEQHQLVIGLKEPPVSIVGKKQVHLCFSHTVKGQVQNMPLLQHIIDQQATLIDYELMVDSATGKRTIAFGKYAGIAGAIDSLWIAGQKLALIKKQSFLLTMKQTHHYQIIKSARKALSEIDTQSGTAVRILIIGKGNVGQGAESVCRWLGLPCLAADKFIANELPTGSWYCVVNSEHIHKRVDGGIFDKAEFYKKGKSEYVSILESFVDRFDILLQSSYWTDFYPRHLNNQQLIRLKDELPWVIGDISCDIDGSFICTQKASSIDSPSFNYDPLTASMTDGISWSGVTVMSIDNLPCELSVDSSEHFSTILEEYMPHLMNMDLNESFDTLNIPAEIKNAVIVYKGKLTDSFQYLKESL